MLDAGTGVFRLPPLLQTDQLEILLSHAHLDHVVGLTFLLGISAIKPLKRVRVWGEAEKLEAVRTHLFHELLFPVLPEWLEFQPLPKSTFSLAGARVRYQPLTHPGCSVGYRLDWPKSSLAYITDTVADATAEYISLIRGVDLLIHECNFTREEKQFAQTTATHGMMRSDALPRQPMRGDCAAQF